MNPPVSCSRATILRIRLHNLPGLLKHVAQKHPSLLRPSTLLRDSNGTISSPPSFASSMESPNDADLQPSFARPSHPRLQEVTGVLSRTFQCPSCPQTFATLIALRTHFTKSHVSTSDAAAPPSRTDADAHVTPPALHAPATDAPPTSQLVLREKFMRYAKDGMPTCTLCLRRFCSLGLPSSTTTTPTPVQPLTTLMCHLRAFRRRLLLVR